MEANELTYCRENIEFTVKGPIPLYYDESRKATSGCAVIDVILAKPSTVGEIVFRNYYVASVNVLVQTEKEDPTSSNGARVRTVNPWQISIQKKVLMPAAHEEQGSHDVFSITANESVIPWEKVTMMRIILRQPSPLWFSFRLEELNLYADLPRLGAPHQINDMQKFLEVIRRHTTKALTAIGTAPSNELSRTTSAVLVTEGTKLNDNSTPVLPMTIPYEIHKLPMS